jgi:hypothetical protein
MTKMTKEKATKIAQDVQNQVENNPDVSKKEKVELIATAIYNAVHENADSDKDVKPEGYEAEQKELVDKDVRENPDENAGLPDNNMLDEQKVDKALGQ